MKIYIQWATDPAQGWIEIDSSEWNTLPKKPVPVGGEVLDSTPGWINAINCQGIIWNNDHYSVIDEPVTGGIIVVGWNDDTDDWTPDLFNAIGFLIEPIQPDDRLGGSMNTKQTRFVFAAPTVHSEFLAQGPTHNSILDTWDNFVPAGQTKKMQQINKNQLDIIYANTDAIKHGVWMTDTQFQEHEAVQIEHPWMEWIS